MKNLEVLSKEKVSLFDLSLMLRLVKMEYGNLPDEELAYKISEEFDIDCSKEDIVNYNKQTLVSEDYELEERKELYGIKY